MAAVSWEELECPVTKERAFRKVAKPAEGAAAGAGRARKIRGGARRDVNGRIVVEVDASLGRGARQRLGASAPARAERRSRLALARPYDAHASLPRAPRAPPPTCAGCSRARPLRRPRRAQSTSRRASADRGASSASPPAAPPRERGCRGRRGRHASAATARAPPAVPRASARAAPWARRAPPRARRRAARLRHATAGASASSRAAPPPPFAPLGRRVGDAHPTGRELAQAAPPVRGGERGLQRGR